jgi:hypothetical protein
MLEMWRKDRKTSRSGKSLKREKGRGQEDAAVFTGLRTEIFLACLWEKSLI